MVITTTNTVNFLLAFSSLSSTKRYVNGNTLLGDVSVLAEGE